MKEKTGAEQVVEVAHEVRKLLDYAQALGVREIPRAKSQRRAPAKAAAAAPSPDRSAPTPKGAAAPDRSAPMKATPTPDRSAPAPAATQPKGNGEKARALEALRAEMGDCKRCGLHKGRTNLVFGVGNPDAHLMFVGEGPGRDEDLQGIPFVGRAGQLLTKIIEAMGMKRDDVYIANIVKSRPPNNRAPEPDKVAACMPFLMRQIEIIGPEVIVCLGSVATQNLLGTERKITALRGHFQDFHGTPTTRVSSLRPDRHWSARACSPRMR